MQVAIPFSGFYNTLHEAALDDELRQMFSDESGEPYDDLHERAYTACRWHGAFVEYAKAYAEKWSEESTIAATFVELWSPREYNFDTNRIYCEVSAQEIARVFDQVDKESLRATVAERLKPRSGFMPFYSDDLDAWGAVETWEAPQVALLLEVYASKYLSDDDYIYLMDDCSGNGEFTQWLESAIPDDELAALYNETEARRKQAA